MTHQTGVPMVQLASLWLPILLSAVFVFIASSVIHMAPLWHRGDYRPVPRQDELLGALRPFAPPPGEYMLPFCTDRKELQSPQFAEKMRQGPVAMLTVLPNRPFSMVQPLIQWFIYLLVVAVIVAVLLAHVLPAGTAYPRVFKVAALAAFMGYALGLIQNSIWLRRSWGLTAKACVDGLIYAGLTAGTFGWLWPH
jgi:hypothetical protein